jgi:hypothetical protein
LLLDKGNTHKGQLHFVADFVPAMLLKNARFDAPRNEIQQAVEEHQADSSDSVKTINSDEKQETTSQDDGIEEDKLFQPGHTKGLKSTDTTRTVDTTYTMETTKTSATGYTTGTVDESKYEGLEMTREQLLNHRR